MNKPTLEQARKITADILGGEANELASLLDLYRRDKSVFQSRRVEIAVRNEMERLRALADVLVEGLPKTEEGNDED